MASLFTYLAISTTRTPWKVHYTKSATDWRYVARRPETLWLLLKSGGLTGMESWVYACSCLYTSIKFAAVYMCLCFDKYGCPSDVPRMLKSCELYRATVRWSQRLISKWRGLRVASRSHLKNLDVKGLNYVTLYHIHSEERPQSVA